MSFVKGMHFSQSKNALQINLHFLLKVFLQSGITVERPEMVESTSLGAAFAAAVGIKLKFFDDDDVHSNVTSFKPEMESADKERKFLRWKKAISRCLDWV